MGETADQIEREIAEIRADTDMIVDELERRVRGLLDVRHAAEDHPMAAAAVGAALVLAIGVGAFGLFEAFRPAPPEPKGLVGTVRRTARRIQASMPIQVTISSKADQKRRQQDTVAKPLFVRALTELVGIFTQRAARTIGF